MTTDNPSLQNPQEEMNPAPSAPVMDEQDDKKKDKKGQEGESATQPPQFDVGTTIERIDPLTVDIIVRANPQKSS